MKMKRVYQTFEFVNMKATVNKVRWKNNYSFLYFLSFSLLAACTGVTGTITSTETNDTTVVNTSVPIAVRSDSFPAFPQDVEILLPDQYRKESTGYPKGVEEKEWFEIYRDETTKNWIVAKTVLEISYSRDECVGEDVMIVGSKHKNALLFFTPFKGLSGKVETVLEHQPLIPTKPVVFSMNGTAYNLSPDGVLYSEADEVIKADELKKDEEGIYFIDQIKSYRLTFQSGTSNPYEICSSEMVQGVTPTLLWAGDINNDGLPDMILDMSDFYESKHLYFFLSDPGDKDKPVKKLADLKVVNDC